jgi:serine/threonine-protein kinase
MDYIEGVSLSAVTAGARRAGFGVPRAVALRIAIEALHGLHAAHEQADHEGNPLGIVHRDVSPQNILVGIDGSVRVTDFGIARAQNRLAETSTGTLKGKLNYMAPEQARSEVVDRRADVFALGVLIWELLAGDKAYKGETELLLLQQALAADIPPLSSTVPGVPSALEVIVARAVAKTPEARFATAAELADALEAFAFASGEVATTSDVAALVAAAAGPTLERRRAELADLMTGRSRPELRLLATATGAGPRPTVPEPGGAPFATLGGSSATGVRLAGAGRPRASVVAAAIAVTAALAGVVVGLAARSPTPPEPAAAPSPSAPITAPTATAPTKVRITLTSDAPIQEVRAPGVADVAFQEGGVAFELPRSDAPVALTIVLAGGRELHETVRPTESSTIRLLASPPLATASPSTTGASPRTSPKAPTAPRAPLKKNPYE